jgi:hypothetical protein
MIIFWQLEQHLSFLEYLSLGLNSLAAMYLEFRNIEKKQFYYYFPFSIEVVGVLGFWGT